MSRARLLAAAWIFALLVGCDPPGSDVAIPPRDAFGRTGYGPGEFSYPRAATIAPNGDLYVVDKTARIQRFSPEGNLLREWRMPEWEAGKPTGVGIAPDGRLFAADTHYARVIAFAPDGTEVARFGSFGIEDGQFRLPTDVAIAADGTIFVGEYSGNDRISRFTPEYEYIDSFGGAEDGEAALRRPQGLCIAPDNTLWVADSGNHRICRFSFEGELLSSFGERGRGPGQFRFPYNVERLSDGSLIVVEYGNNRVQRFDSSGRYLGGWGRAGREPGELAYPWAVAVGPNDRIYVIDSGNNRVQIISPKDFRKLE